MRSHHHCLMRFVVMFAKQRMSAQLTEVGCARPLACCAFSASGAHLATASWAGVLKVWDIPSGRLSTTIKGACILSLIFLIISFFIFPRQ